MCAAVPNVAPSDSFITIAVFAFLVGSLSLCMPCAPTCLCGRATPIVMSIAVAATHITLFALAVQAMLKATAAVDTTSVSWSASDMANALAAFASINAPSAHLLFKASFSAPLAMIDVVAGIATGPIGAIVVCIAVAILLLVAASKNGGGDSCKCSDTQCGGCACNCCNCVGSSGYSGGSSFWYGPPWWWYWFPQYSYYSGNAYYRDRSRPPPPTVIVVQSPLQDPPRQQVLPVGVIASAPPACMPAPEVPSDKLICAKRETSFIESATTALNEDPLPCETDAAERPTSAKAGASALVQESYQIPEHGQAAVEEWQGGTRSVLHASPPPAEMYDNPHKWSQCGALTCVQLILACVVIGLTVSSWKTFNCIVLSV